MRQVPLRQLRCFSSRILEKNLRRWTERKYRSFSEGWWKREERWDERKLRESPVTRAEIARFFLLSLRYLPPTTPNSDGYPHKWRETSKTLGYLPGLSYPWSPDKIRGSHVLSPCRVQCSCTYLAVRLLVQLLLNYLQRSSVSKLRGVTVIFNTNWQ